MRYIQEYIELWSYKSWNRNVDSCNLVGYHQSITPKSAPKTRVQLFFDIDAHMKPEFAQKAGRSHIYRVCRNVVSRLEGQLDMVWICSDLDEFGVGKIMLFTGHLGWMTIWVLRSISVTEFIDG